MKVKPPKLQYTIRGVPAEADSALKQEAKRQNRSLNQLLIDELSKLATSATQKADFSDLVGRWTPDPGFDEILASQRQIDWKSGDEGCDRYKSPHGSF